jgi:hypothetical protein
MQAKNPDTGMNHEKIQELLEEHQNQIKYLKTVHRNQRRRVKNGLNLESKSAEANSGEGNSSLKNSLTSNTSAVRLFDSTRSSAVGGDFNVEWSRHSSDQNYAEFELETPLRLPSKFSTDSTDTENELLTNYYGYWLTENEVKHILTHELIPTPYGVDKVKWKRPNSVVLLSPEKYTERAYIESIEEYPKVFKELKEFHKTTIIQKALKKFIGYDPTAVGMIARRQYVEEQKTYYHLTGRNSKSVVPIETLLEEVEQGHVLRKSWNFFPETRNRLPFKSFEYEFATWTVLSSFVCRSRLIVVLLDERSACYWLRKTLYSKITENISIPTLEQFKQAYLKGKAQGFDMWYQEFFDLIYDATGHNRKELKFFMSLLATSSPNSSISQNTMSALFNYRALSQGSRPQFGSYPFRSLLNYLAGGLGRPSGRKVRCFLENLIRPQKSTAVTIDTHMQKFLVGTGRLSLSAFEYAVLKKAPKFYT